MPDTVIPTPGDEYEVGCNEFTPPPSDHPVNQDSESFDSEDELEPPNHATPGKCLQCGAYRWLERNCTQCNGVYEPVNRANVYEDSDK